MARGRITVLQYIKHRNLLLSNGLWLDNYQCDDDLRNTIGPRFFYLMANLDRKNFNELISASLKQQVQYMDYKEQCRFNRLLDKEKDDGPVGVDARETLRLEREYYRSWKDYLYGSDYTFKEETQSTESQSNTSTSTTGATSGGATQRACSFWAVFGSVIYFAIR
jgi:hypothetical protein